MEEIISRDRSFSNIINELNEYKSIFFKNIDNIIIEYYFLSCFVKEFKKDRFINIKNIIYIVDVYPFFVDFN
jgi:hypothetical protein